MNDYIGVLGQFSSEYIVSRSRFIAHISNVSSQEEATEYINDISRKYNDATHNCYAYIANAEMTVQKFSDDKEPHGTAGIPILEILKKKELACSAVVVTRYFGGIKLGTGGLVAAYTKATQKVIEQSNIVKFRYSQYIRVDCDYSNKDKIIQAVLSCGGEIVDTVYLGKVEIGYAVPIDDTQKVIEAVKAVTAGQVEQKLVDKKYYIYK